MGNTSNTKTPPPTTTTLRTKTETTMRNSEQRTDSTVNGQRITPKHTLSALRSHHKAGCIGNDPHIPPRPLCSALPQHQGDRWWLSRRRINDCHFLCFIILIKFS